MLAGLPGICITPSRQYRGHVSGCKPWYPRKHSTLEDAARLSHNVVDDYQLNTGGGATAFPGDFEGKEGILEGPTEECQST